MSELRNPRFRYTQHVQNECICSRCGQVYKNPKKLACGHIACFECVKQMSGHDGRCGICDSPIDITAVRSCKSEIISAEMDDGAGPKWLRHSLNDLKVACCRGNCVFRGRMGEYRTHECPTAPATLNDLDVLIKIVEDDPRVPVKTECFRMLVDELLLTRDAENDGTLLYEMYRLMTQLKWIADVQKIGLDALIVLCTAEEWRDVVKQKCGGLNEHLLSLSNDVAFGKRIAGVRRLIPDLSAIHALRDMGAGILRHDTGLTESNE